MLDVDSADAERDAVSIGALLLARASNDRIPTLGTHPITQAALSQAPTTVREFRTDEALLAYAAIIEKDNRTRDLLDVTFLIRRADGREVLRQRARAIRPDGGDFRGRGFLTLLQLGNLEPGSYSLTVSASTKKKAVEQSSNLRVVAGSPLR